VQYQSTGVCDIIPMLYYKPITNTAWVRARLCKLQKGCTRLAIASDKIYQLLPHGRWFSLGTPASSTTKTGRHDIAEILLKVAFNTKNQIKSNPLRCNLYYDNNKYYLVGAISVHRCMRHYTNAISHHK
jgi:hypothetical protein